MNWVRVMLLAWFSGVAVLTLRLLAGLIRPTAGAATILGYDTYRQRVRAQRSIGYLPADREKVSA